MSRRLPDPADFQPISAEALADLRRVLAAADIGPCTFGAEPPYDPFDPDPGDWFDDYDCDDEVAS